MIENKQDYHARRAAAERARADGTSDIAIARAHRELAQLHDERASVAEPAFRPRLRLV